MLRNYLFIALYHLKHQPVFSAIKVLSLAIGLGCSILVIMHVQYAWSFDKHFPNWENTYRLVTSLTLDFRMHTEMTNDAAPHQMRLDYPQIEHLAMVRPGSATFTQGAASSNNSFYWADQEIIDVFSLAFLAGEPAGALAEPFSVVLSETAARKYFPDGDAMGSILTLNDQFDLRVTGLIRDLPKNTHLDFQILVSTATGRQAIGEYFMKNEGWNGFGGTRTYLTLPDKAVADYISGDLANFMDRNLPADQKGYAQRTNQTLYLEPLADIYLSPRQGFGQTSSNRSQILMGLMLFGGLILATSCINFANLSLTQMQQRSREIGIRKALGAKRWHIVLQFLLESLLLTVLALCLALPFVYFGIPVYTSLTGTDFTFADAMSGRSIAVLVLFVLATGLLSGLLPALGLARYEPASIIKGYRPVGRIRRLSRSGVTVIQFGFSTALVLLAVAISLQIRHLNTMDIGFNKNDLVLLSSTFTPVNPDVFNFPAMIDELRQHPGVIAVAKAGTFPPNTGALNPWRLPSWAPEESRSVRHLIADENYLDAMQLRLLAGRWFALEFPSDFVEFALPGEDPLEPDTPRSYGVVITRSAAMSYGFGAVDAALGKEFLHGGDNYRVIGVVEDFRLSGGLEDPLTSTMMLRATRQLVLGSLLIRIDPAQRDSALAHIDTVWQKHRPDLAIDRRFYEQTFSELVDAQTRGINFAAIFASGITIVISAFGLYALAFYSTQRRTKEIGVRKVVGATSRKIIALLTWDFLKPVLLACVLASVAGTFAILFYFRNFSSRTEIPPLLYAVVAGCTLLVAVVTVALQCYRGANADPVKSLRYE